VVTGHQADRFDLDARGIHVHQHEAQGVLGGLAPRAQQAEDAVGVMRVRGPDLRAVDDIAIAFALGESRHAAEVGTRTRLRKTLTPLMPPVDDGRQQLCTLLGRAELHHHRTDVGQAQRGQQRRAAQSSFVEQQVVLDLGQTGTAELLRPVTDMPQTGTQLFYPRGAALVISNLGTQDILGGHHVRVQLCIQERANLIQKFAISRLQSVFKQHKTLLSVFVEPHAESLTRCLG
jgi:hypothetical protein